MLIWIMLIIFTAHALIRMRERKIDRKEAQKAVKSPDMKKTMADGITIFKKEKLEIVGEIIKNKIIVITIYWL